MPHRPTIWPIETPRHAPLIAANFGRATRELHSSLIKRSNSASSVGRVDRRRQSVEQVAKLPAPVAELAFRLHLLLLVRIPSNSVRDGAAVRNSAVVSRCCPPRR